MSTEKSKYALACVLLLATAAAPAATITASTTQMPGVGDIISISLHGDFSTLSTIGGGFDIFFDNSQLQFHSFGFSDAANLFDDPLLRRVPDVLDGELNGIGFGNFAGLGGVFELAVVQFQVLSAGTSQLTLMTNEGGPPSNPGGFFDINGAAMPVEFIGAQITTIPLPPTIWLLTGAASMLLGFSRNNKTVVRNQNNKKYQD